MKIKNYTVKFTKKANDDINDIYDYILNKYFDVFAAGNAYNRIFKDIRNIIPYPYAYPEIDIDLLRNKGIHLKKTRKYKIFYSVGDEIILIIHICSNKKSYENIIVDLLERIT